MVKILSLLVVVFTSTLSAGEKGSFGGNSEKESIYEIMNLAGGYFEIIDPADQEAIAEQTMLIHSASGIDESVQQEAKVLTPIKPVKEESKKIFDNHIQAAQSILRVHTTQFSKMVPGIKLIGAGGNFMNKIHSLHMLYSSPVIPFDEYLFAMMLFSFLEDLNNHEERFRPFLSTFPLTSENYELRIMLKDYRTLSSKEASKLAFIFNLGDTIYLCHRDDQSKKLQIYKRLKFGKVLEECNQKIKSENDNKEKK